MMRRRRAVNKYIFGTSNSIRNINNTDVYGFRVLNEIKIYIGSTAFTHTCRIVLLFAKYYQSSLFRSAIE